MQSRSDAQSSVSLPSIKELEAQLQAVKATLDNYYNELNQALQAVTDENNALLAQIEKGNKEFSTMLNEIVSKEIDAKTLRQNLIEKCKVTYTSPKKAQIEIQSGDDRVRSIHDIRHEIKVNTIKLAAIKKANEKLVEEKQQQERKKRLAEEFDREHKKLKGLEADIARLFPSARLNSASASSAAAAPSLQGGK